jgi:hypothetical protein
VQEFWDNFYLRGQVIWDSTGQVSRQLYEQPGTGLPFGRGFIIDQTGRVALPYFGHQPQMAIAKIHELLAATSVARPPARPGMATVSARVLYDLLGRRIASVESGAQRSGNASARTMRAKAAGVYVSVGTVADLRIHFDNNRCMREDGR